MAEDKVKVGDFLSYNQEYYSMHTFDILMYPHKKYKILKVTDDDKTQILVIDSEDGLLYIRYHPSIENFIITRLQEERIAKIKSRCECIYLK